jgi:hypothetical protein
MALDTHVDDKLKRMPGVGSGAYTVAGAVATITGSLTAPQLEELVRTAAVTRHEVVVVAGVVKIQPRP